MRLQGTVTTPKVPQQPQGPLWDRLRKAKSKAQVEKVREEAERHGYSPDGQLMHTIRDALRAHR